LGDSIDVTDCRRREQGELRGMKKNLLWNRKKGRKTSDGRHIGGLERTMFGTLRGSTSKVRNETERTLSEVSIYSRKTWGVDFQT